MCINVPDGGIIHTKSAARKRGGGNTAARGGRSNVEEGKKQEKGAITCRRCWQEGHTQNECKNPPLCYFCHDSGHMPMHCPESEA
jgi:hypothetical protein